MAGRAVLSDDEENEVEVDEEDPRPSRGNRDYRDDGDDDDDEEEEDDGEDEYEKDDFIVDDADEEEEEGEEEEQNDERRKKKKKKKRESEEFMLDEDDYMLLQDNNITGISRPKLGNKFKRLKKAGRESEMDDRSGFSDDDGTGKKRTGKERVEYSLFGGDVPVEEDIIDEEEQQGDEEIPDDEDEMAGFIVDEEEMDENGQFVKKKKFKRNVPRQAAGVSSSALQEAHDIFGDVDDLLERRKMELEREAANSGELRGKRLEDEFEPFILAEKYMTAKDEQIKENDVPERMQLSEELTGHPPTDDMIEEESLWIHSQLTGDGCVSFFNNGHTEKDIDQKDIASVLTMLHVNKFEIPFIALYRKENCPTLLEEEDRYYDDLSKENEKARGPAMRFHKLLWAVQTLDKKWLLLQKRKVALEIYYEKSTEGC